MSEIRKLQAPLAEADMRSLKAGDEILVGGVVYTALYMVHKRLCETIEAGRQLPFKLAGAIRRLQVVDFPAVVAYDCYGNGIYKQGSAVK